MRRMGWIAVAALTLLPWASAGAACFLPRPFELDRINREIAGRVVDYTHNHGRDNSLWS